MLAEGIDPFDSFSSFVFLHLKVGEALRLFYQVAFFLPQFFLLTFFLAIHVLPSSVAAKELQYCCLHG